MNGNTSNSADRLDAHAPAPKKIKVYPSFESREFVRFSDALQNALEQTGLVDTLDDHESTCIENGSQFFVELVFTDGARIAAGKELIEELKEEFATSSMRVSGVVRAHWSVGTIVSQGLWRDTDGQMRAATRYSAELQAGSAMVLVSVAVSHAASELIEKRLAAVTGLHISKEQDQLFVRELLESALSRGGESAWDPFLSPNLLLDPPAAEAMAYRLKRRAESVGSVAPQ